MNSSFITSRPGLEPSQDIQVITSYATYHILAVLSKPWLFAQIKLKAFWGKYSYSIEYILTYLLPL